MAPDIERISGRHGRPAVLLREAWREGKRVRKRTVASPARLPPEAVEGFRAVLKGAVAVSDVRELLQVERSLLHGHAAAVPGTMKRLGFGRILGRRKERSRDLAIAAVAARILDPASKLATARALDPETATSSLGALLGLGPVSGNEMLDMLDWLLKRQPRIERSLANRHLKGGNTLILHDVSSSYLEGRCCPLAAFGHSRDGKRGRMQIACGLLCAADGCPVAVEVFAGNASDPSTVAGRADRIRSRFGIDRVALAGDRGMTATARIREDLEPAGLDWISALKTSDIRRLPREGADGAPAPLEPEAPVPDAVAETAGPDFPGERLMVCLNPRLREERARKREELLQAAEETLSGIAAAAARGRPGPANRDRTMKALGAEGQPAPGGEALRRRRARRRDGLGAQPGQDRRRGAARRDLRRAHQPGRRGRRAGGGGGGLQVPRRRGARVPEREGRPPHPPGSCLHRGPRPGARVPVHAGAARGVAHAPVPGANAVRGRRPRGRKGAAGTRRWSPPGSRTARRPRRRTRGPPTGCRSTASGRFSRISRAWC